MRTHCECVRFRDSSSAKPLSSHASCSGLQSPDGSHFDNYFRRLSEKGSVRGVAPKRTFCVPGGSGLLTTPDFFSKISLAF